MELDLSTDEGWAAFQAQHGGYAGEPVRVDDERDEAGRRVQSPFYRYTFKDGSVVVINKAGQIKSMTVRGSTASTAAPPRVKGGDGNWYQIMPDGTSRKVEGIPAAPPAASTAAPPRRDIDGVLHERQPDGTWKPVVPGDKPTGERTTTPSPRDVNEEELNKERSWNAQNTKWGRVTHAEARALEAKEKNEGRTNRPPEPNVSTTAEFIPEWNAQTGQYDWKPNKNYVKPKGPQPTRELMGNEYVEFGPDGSSRVLYTKKPGEELKIINGGLYAYDFGTREIRLLIAPEKETKPPEIIGGASPTQPTLVQRDPQTGAITSVPNPAYQDPLQQTPQARIARAQQEGRALRDRLFQDVQRGAKTKDQAQAELDAYWQQNVEAPLSAYRAAEEQRIDPLRRQEEQFARGDEQSRQTAARQAGQDAVARVQATLPYRVGPAFGKEFADALKVLGSGGGAVNFSADAFTFDMPDLDKVAQQATAQVLQQWSPYARSLVQNPATALQGQAPAFDWSTLAQAPPVNLIPAYGGPGNPYTQTPRPGGAYSPGLPYGT